MLSNTGHLYRQIGESQKAIPFLEKSLEIYRRVPGENNKQLSGNVNILSIAHQDIEEYDKALPFSQEFVALKRDIAAKNPQEIPTLAISLNNLGTIHARMNDNAEAEKCFEEALTIRRRLLGDDHPDTLQSLHTLAHFNKDQGDFVKTMSPLMGEWGGLPKSAEEEEKSPDVYYDKAIPFFEDILASNRRTFGHQHPDTIKSINELANVYYAMENYEKAIPLFEENIAFYRVNFQQDDPQLAMAISSLASMYHANEDYDKAVALYQEGLDKCSKAFGKNHPSTQQITTLLANAKERRTF
jgi:tetratricopeptide (TPR) repeat protein